MAVDGCDGCDGMFEEYLNRKVKIQVKIGEQLLTFTGIVKSVSLTHIKILDKFNEEQMLLIENIEQATPINEVEQHG